MTRKTFKKIITSPELSKQINAENKKLVAKFLKEKNIRSSDLTIKNYDSDMEIFLTWNLLYNDNKFFIDIKKIEFSDFFSFVVEELHWNGARFSRMKSTLSSFSNFLEKFFSEDFPTFRNVILKVIDSMPKEFVREKTILSEDQINKIFAELENKNETQISCWLALGIASGSRFSEILRFTTDIIDENNLAFDGLFLETLKTIKTKGRTKQGKLLKKYILKDLFLVRYKKWLDERKSILEKNNKSHNAIFIKDNGDPANEGTARVWVEKIEKILGSPFYPHALRHFYTTMLSKIGIPPDLIKEVVGWSDLKMIEIYNDQEVKDKSWSELEKLKEYLNKR